MDDISHMRLVLEADGFPVVLRAKLPAYLPIDRNIPIPAPSRPGWKGVPKQRVHWAALECGDSVYIAGRTLNDGRVLTDGPRKRYGHRYVVRAESGGIRVWRTE